MLTQLAIFLATLTLVMLFGYHIIIYLNARKHVSRLTSISKPSYNISNSLKCGLGLSIIVPTKGEPIELLVSATKAKAEALKASTLPKGEVLIISDDEEDYVKRLTHELEGYINEGLVRVVRRERPYGGRTGALDHGAKIAAHDYIMILDSDSKINEKSLSLLHSKICGSNSDVVVLPWTGYSLKSTRLAEALIFNTDTASFLLYKLRWAGGFFIFPLGSGTAIKKTVLRDVGYWGPNVIQDDIWLGTKLAAKGYKPDILPEGSVDVLVPSKIKSFRIQQSRWAYGASEILSRTLRKVMRSPFSLGVRLEMLLYMLQPSFSIPFTLAEILALVAAFMEPGWGILKALHSLSILISLGLAESIILTYAALHINIGKIVKSAHHKFTLVQVGRASAVYGVLFPILGVYSLLGLLRIKLSYRITPKAESEENLGKDLTPYVMAGISSAGVIASLLNGNVVTLLLMLIPLISNIYAIFRLK